MSRPIFGLTVRSLLGQRRTLALVLLSLAPVLAALVFALAADPASTTTASTRGSFSGCSSP